MAHSLLTSTPQPTFQTPLTSPLRPPRSHLSISNPFYASNPLTHFASFARRMDQPAKTTPLAVRSFLIAPDGGEVVDLVVPAERRAAARVEAAGLPTVAIGQVDLEWVHVVGEGWASPLRGFMREGEYLQALHFNCLRMADGSVVNMPIPIVLAIGDEEKEKIGGAKDVALRAPSGELVAVLRREDTPIPRKSHGPKKIVAATQTLV